MRRRRHWAVAQAAALLVLATGSRVPGMTGPARAGTPASAGAVHQPPAARAAAASAGFVSIGALPQPAPSGSMLFLPLADQFSSCLPLAGACPPDSPSLLLVPAAGHDVRWLPDATDLPTVAVDGAAVPAVGQPPPDADATAYLVPVADGSGAGLVYLRRRLDGGALAAEPAGAPLSAPVATPVVGGPNLSTTPPARGLPAATFGTPVVVEAAGLTGATPVLLVRRAEPSRVAFGVRAHPGWHLGPAYVPLVGPDGVAVLARHAGRVGLAVPAPPAPADARPAASAATGAGGRPPAETPAAEHTSGRSGWAIASGVVVAAGLAGLLAATLRRRVRGHDSEPAEP